MHLSLTWCGSLHTTPPPCTRFCYLQKSGTLALWALYVGTWRASRFSLGRGDLEKNSDPYCLAPRCHAPFRSLSKATLAVWGCNGNPVLAPNPHSSTDFDVSPLPRPLSCPSLPPPSNQKGKRKKYWNETGKVCQDMPVGVSGLLTGKSRSSGSSPFFLPCSLTWGSLPEWASVGN